MQSKINIVEYSIDTGSSSDDFVAPKPKFKGKACERKRTKFYGRLVKQSCNANIVEYSIDTGSSSDESVTPKAKLGVEGKACGRKPLKFYGELQG